MTFDPTNTLTLGQEDADHQVWLVLNLGCPDTRDWFNANFAALEAAVAAGRVQAHLQFWSKQRVKLVNGAIADCYIDYAHPESALDFIKAVFADQDALNAASDVPAYLEGTYHVQRHPQAELIAAQVAEAVGEAGITSVPTVVYDGKLYFDDTLNDAPAF